MFVIIGYVVALGCIFGAYIIHGGNIGVILHAIPTEMMAIGGGALGAFVVANQPKTLKAVFKALPTLLKGSKYTKARYMELMALLYDILQKARKEGLMAIENDVEQPHSSPLFQKYTTVGSDHHVVEFITDYLRMMVSGNLNSLEIEALMDSEIETHHHEGTQGAAQNGHQFRRQRVNDHGHVAAVNDVGPEDAAECDAVADQDNHGALSVPSAARLRQKKGPARSLFKALECAGGDKQEKPENPLCRSSFAELEGSGKLFFSASGSSRSPCPCRRAPAGSTGRRRSAWRSRADG